jgi:hypothetical protein
MYKEQHVTEGRLYMHVKINFSLCLSCRYVCERMEVQRHSFETSALFVNDWSTSRTGCFGPRKRAVISIEQVFGWLLEQIWTLWSGKKSLVVPRVKYVHRKTTFCYASRNISEFLCSYVNFNCTGVVRRHINRSMHFAFLLLEPMIRASVPADKYGNWAGWNE